MRYLFTVLAIMAVLALLSFWLGYNYCRAYPPKAESRNPFKDLVITSPDEEEIVRKKQGVDLPLVIDTVLFTEGTGVLRIVGKEKNLVVLGDTLLIQSSDAIQIDHISREFNDTLGPYFKLYKKRDSW